MILSVDETEISELLIRVSSEMSVKGLSHVLSSLNGRDYGYLVEAIYDYVQSKVIAERAACTREFNERLAKSDH